MEENYELCLFYVFEKVSKILPVGKASRLETADAYKKRENQALNDAQKPAAHRM